MQLFWPWLLLLSPASFTVMRSPICLIAWSNFCWLLLQAFPPPSEKMQRGQLRSCMEEQAATEVMLPSLTCSLETQSSTWAEHKNSLQEGCSELSETCPKICRKLLLLQAALTPTPCPAWVTKRRQGWDASNSRAPHSASAGMEGCEQYAASPKLSFGESGKAEGVLLLGSVFWEAGGSLYFSHHKWEEHTCVNRQVWDGSQLLAQALRNLHRPRLEPGWVPVFVLFLAAY